MPDNKPYNSLSDHLKEKLGSKTVKLSVNAGFTCPNAIEEMAPAV